MQHRAFLVLAASLLLAPAAGWTPAVALAASAPSASASIGPALAARALAGPGRMTLLRTSRQLSGTGDPIWQLRLEIPGQAPRSFEALVGRASRQQGDRHHLGSQAPLPRGTYHVSEIVSLADQQDLSPELGQLLWIGLEPEFPTDRRGLGIHLDPSAGKPQNSGTDGCIGLIHPRELLALGELLRRSGTTSLEVMH